MNIVIPGLSDIITVVKEMPGQFNVLTTKMDELVNLVKETNEILKDRKDA